MRQKIFQGIGVVGTLGCVVVFLNNPSFLTPDKILVFLIFVFMIFSQAIEMLKRFFPFVAILLVYESFRSIADSLNKRVEYKWLASVDRWLSGGTLPTTTLQRWLWHGHIKWYDFMFYIPYMLHFVAPISLAVVVWKLRPAKYWQLVVSYVTVSFSGFLAFLAFPSAPPWMSSQFGYIERIHRVSSDVWWALGIKNFPSLYNDISPNPVAAMPSLHAAYSTLFALYVTSLFKSKWKYLAWIFPILIYIGTVYQGEHYAIDEIAGVFLAVAVFYASPFLTRKIASGLRYIKNKTLSLKDRT